MSTLTLENQQVASRQKPIEYTQCRYFNSENVPIILKSINSKIWTFERVIAPQTSIDFFAPYNAQLRIIPLSPLNGVILFESDTISCQALVC